MNFRHEDLLANHEIAGILFSSDRNTKSCALWNTFDVFRHFFMEVRSICTDEAQTTYLRMRANMTILECLHSETLLLGEVDDAAVHYLSWALPTKGETMRSSGWISESHSSSAGLAGPTEGGVGQSGREPAGTKVHRAMLLVLVIAALAAMPLPARSQSLLSPEDSSSTSRITAPEKLDLTYVRPTEGTKVNNFVFDAFGPYPIVGAGIAAGIDQWTNAPPEWGQGLKATASGLGPTSGSRLSEPPRVTEWRKPLRKTP